MEHEFYRKYIELSENKIKSNFKYLWPYAKPMKNRNTFPNLLYIICHLDISK